MANLDNYFRQHKEISELINTIKTMAIKDLIANSKEIATTLNNLSGKLKVHLSMEDRYLYPNLKAKNESKNIAEKFENEMGNLAKEFLNYKEKYNTYIKITE
ncbi:MAG: hemerythrin domain-containing protein, partial [Fusobacteriaceae bacterium]|nr:hemerythrin domain-containing protein [Fusobacteriaceae bacterium]